MNATKKTSTAQRASRLGFIAIQLVIVAVAIGATTHRQDELHSLRALPAMRNEPLRIAPLYDYPLVVTDEQLESVLNKLQPRLRGAKPKINHVDHALRFWGLEARFDDPDCLSGVEMRQLLLDDSSYTAVWGDAPALLRTAGNGLRIRTKEGYATASHVDHTLAGLAEIGTPLDFVVQTRSGVSSMRALLEQSLWDFSLNQGEYEWSTLAYALYLQPSDGWISREGQRITFDRLAGRMMRQSYSQGVCFGNHRLHSLVVLLRVDDQQPILSPATRSQIIEHLQEATVRLTQNQHLLGYFNGHWAKGSDLGRAIGDEKGDRLADRILATGHALEWWALAPSQTHPPREVLFRAGQWLCLAIEELDEKKTKSDYTYLTHAGRALALWRGRFPAEFLGGESVSDESLARQ